MVGIQMRLIIYTLIIEHILYNSKWTLFSNTLRGMRIAKTKILMNVNF